MFFNIIPNEAKKIFMHGMIIYTIYYFNPFYGNILVWFYALQVIFYRPSI